MKRDGKDPATRGQGLRSRRRFLKLVAAGSVAALAGNASAARVVAATATTPRRPKVATPEVRTEIKSQKDSLDRALKVVREFQLPTGSEMAFNFPPLEPASMLPDDSKTTPRAK